jgi:hypothetical protein
MKPATLAANLTKVYPQGTCAANDISFAGKADELTIVLGLPRLKNQPFPNLTDIAARGA